MQSPTSKTDEGTFPNIILKKKLAPLPLFKQNNRTKSFTPNAKMEKTCFGFRSPGLFPAQPHSPTKTFLNEMKTVNNYGRLCDQPFLEFSSFHFEQVFGSADKKRSLAPVSVKNGKKQISKMHTIGDFNKSLKLLNLKTNDPPKGPSSKKDKKPKENLSILKKVYKIGEYEAIIAFYSLEVVLSSTEEDGSIEEIPLRIGKQDLKAIYKKSPTDMANEVLASLAYNDDRLTVNIKKDKDSKTANISDQNYPEKKEGLSVTLNGQTYTAKIHYPYLEILITELHYKERLILKPTYLSNLYEANFDNLDQYIQRFSLPPVVYKTKEELRADKLKSIPTVIKKVIKTQDFGGLMLFKGLEVHLRNTSDLQPETVMHESTLTPMAKNILKRKKKEVNNILLRLNISDLERTHKCTAQELTELIQESLTIEEGEGFALRVPEEKTNAYHHRHSIKEDSLPEISDKFNHRFNKFLYEGFIKFPTLELYVPETNFRDVIQLKPSQIKDLIDNAFENMDTYLSLFNKPPPPRSSVRRSSSILIEKAEPQSRLVVISVSGDHSSPELAQQALSISKSLNQQVDKIVLTRDGRRTAKELEDDIKKLGNAEYLIVVSRASSDEDTESVRSFLEGIKAAKFSLKEKKVFFIQVSEGTAQDSEKAVNEQINRKYSKLLTSVGLVLLRSLALSEESVEARGKSIERRLKNLGQTLEYVKSSESLGDEDDFTRANERFEGN